jgi:hypothetical protein
MKTTLFLNDEAAQARLLLQNGTPAKATAREPEAVAGCNCDRWGHPCLRCTEPNVQTTNLLPTEV